MSHRLLHRTTAVPAVLALTAALAVVMPQGETASADSKTYNNACMNSVTPNWDQIGITNSMTAPAAVPAGSKFALTGISLQMAVPGSIFLAGYNLGLLPKGTSIIPANVYEVIDATNTVEGSRPTNTVSTPLTITITDPDGIRGNGDETATDATGTAQFADMTWTAKSGVIDFSEHDDQAISGIDHGGVVALAEVIAGNPPVQFHCTSGSVQGPGQPAPPAVVTFSKSPVAATTRTTGAAPGTHATALALSRSSAKVRKGTLVRFPGRLRDTKTGLYLNGQRVYLQRRSSPTAPWSNVKSALTKRVSGKNGVVVLAVRAKRTFYYDLYYPGTSTLNNSRSKTIRIKVR